MSFAIDSYNYWTTTEHLLTALMLELGLDSLDYRKVTQKGEKRY